MRRALPPLAAALLALAYRDLARWSSGAPELPALEGWIFVASGIPPQVILALSAAALWLRLPSVVAARGAPARVLASVAFAASLVALAWGRHASAGAVVLLSAAAFGLGAAAWSGGRARARVVAPLVACMLLATPLPQALTHLLVYPLQLATAAFAERGLELLDVPAVRHADVVELAARRFLVIETCSGLGSLVTLTTVAAFWALARRATPLQAALLIAAATPIALLVNGLRVLTLMLVPGSSALTLHVGQGLLLFFGGVLGIYGVDRLLERALPGTPSGDAAEAPLPTPPSQALPWAVAALLALLSIATPVRPAAAGPPWSVALPDAIGARTAEPAPLDTGFLGTVHFDWSRSIRYAGPGGDVTVFLGSTAPGTAPGALLSRKLDVPGAGHAVLATHRGRLAGEPARFTLAAAHREPVLSAVVRRDVGGVVEETLRELLGIPDPRRAPRVLRLSTGLGAPPAEAAAEARLQQVAAALVPLVAAEPSREESDSD